MNAQMMPEMAYDLVTFEPPHNEHQMTPFYHDAIEPRAIKWTSRGDTFGPRTRGASSRAQSSPRPDGKYHPSAIIYKPPFKPLSSLPPHSVHDGTNLRTRLRYYQQEIGHCPRPLWCRPDIYYWLHR